MKKKNVWILLSIIAIGVSCQDKELLEEKKNERPLTRASHVEEPILTPQEIFNRQSSLEMMIINQIAFKDSSYTLDITLEETRDLGIPDSLYYKYRLVVEELNKKDE